MAKKTLAEMQAELDETAHNSNLSNIAHGLRHLEMAKRDALKEIEKFNTEVAKLQKELEELATKDQLDLSYDDVYDPYNRSQNIALTFSTNKFKAR